MREYKYHYTYVLIDANNKLYIGVHSSNNILNNYMGSSTDKTYKPIAKHILSFWPTRKEAAAHEIRLHSEFDVAKNPLFANKCKHTSVSFDVTGTRRSVETRAKMSAAKMGRILTAENKEKLLMANKGRALTAEHRGKLSEASRGRLVPIETRNKISISQKPQVYLWSHPSLGQIKCTVYELSKLYNLDGYSLYKVIRGKYSHHKKWTIS